MRNEDIQKEIDRMTNNRFVTDSIGTMDEQKAFDNKRNYVMIEKLIEDVVTQLDKDPMDQMVDTETIIREFVKAAVLAEREACAQMLEAASKTGEIISCMGAAKAIRARG